MFAIGDIVKIYAPIAGRNKFHLCVDVGSHEKASRFIYLNSNPNYSSCYSVPCERVPCIEPSETGQTAFSFSMLPRYSFAQLKTYKAEKVGELDASLAAELLAFAETLNTLTKAELLVVSNALASIAPPQSETTA
jgi:hypothetical protein